MIFSRAEASSIIFTPNVINTEVGKTFTLPVVIDGAGSNNYTVRLFLTFSPQLLEITSFSLGPNWIGVSQPGYDSIDNKQGQLIKTAGFPKGFSSTTSFGTIAFRAKGAGDSTIVVGTKTFILDSGNKSTLASRPQVHIIIASAAVPGAPAPSIQPQPLPNLPAGEPNLFDVNIAPAQNANHPGATFFILLLTLAIILGIVGRIIFVKIRRRSLIKKIKHDKDIKN
ncbi:MAG TPA: cohesin domain-containing protein [Candidatus Paceibacterota bacterium]|nr:cohesin domain-containing protein [Candidatus Paceibacterota bacterium]